MPAITATAARATLYTLMDEVASSHEPVLITGKRNNVVIISEEDWQAINETLYLMSTPGMRESLIEGLNTPIEEFDDEVNW